MLGKKLAFAQNVEFFILGFTRHYKFLLCKFLKAIKVLDFAKTAEKDTHPK